ncbi:MAG: hypothetical protein NC123_04380 [Butyrivibrio sp.]|nr:hypothetical protein [Acetatifactor muris]MCM1558765.1 hypothetical protein [Butyrivibrio sp.]
MLEYINTLIGFDLFDTIGPYYGAMVIVIFAVMAIEFFTQIVMTFWRWLLHDK